MMEQVIDLLTDLGFEPIGETPRRVVKTLVSNPNDRSGFSPRLSQVGGRQKFEKGNTRVTVGKRTTCVYSVGTIQEKFCPIQVTSSRNFDTRQVGTIREYLEANQ
jgi:hypothetical protein